MKTGDRLTSVLLALLFVATPVALSACGEEESGVVEEAKEAGEEAAEAMDAAKDTAEEMSEEAEDAADEVEDEVEKATE